MKKAQKIAKMRRTIENGMKILDIFGENRLEFIENSKIIEI